MAKTSQSESKHSVELLAPVGGWEQLRAAVANGADAVYLGLGDFNARQKATNFTPDELPEVVSFAHGHNVRLYVTMNTVLFPEELAQAAEYVSAIASAGVDAVIVQDVGLAKLIRRMAPDLLLHGSTQMTLSEPAAINWAVKNLGLSRVILPRELSVEQIAEIRRQTTAELEVFVHGAICISYSGQCFASQRIGARSANRGQCAQPCRLRYELFSDGEDITPVDEDYLLSPYDLCGLRRIPELLAAGVCSLKIEGRMKSPAYVAAVTQTYRHALDAALAGDAVDVDESTIETLRRGFSRGFTEGYLGGEKHGELIGRRSPKKQGQCVGEVVRSDSETVTVRLIDSPVGMAGQSELLAAGDGVVFAEDLPDEYSPGGRVYSVQPVNAQPAEPSRNRGRDRYERNNRQPRQDVGQRVRITFARDGINTAGLRVGLRVWKTDDPRWRKQWEKTYSRVETVHPTPLDMVVMARVNQPLRLIATDTKTQRAITVTGESQLQRAQRRPATLDMLRDQLGRLGDTPFILGEVVLRGASGPTQQVDAMIPKSEINAARRQVVEQLLAVRQAEAQCDIVEPQACQQWQQQVQQQVQQQADATREQADTTQAWLLVRTTEQLEATLQSAAETPGALTGVYVDFDNHYQQGRALETLRAADLQAGLVTPRVLHFGQADWVQQQIDLQPDVLLLRSLGALSLAKSSPTASSVVNLVADFSLNIANELAADVLCDWGFQRVTPSYDLPDDFLQGFLQRVARPRIEWPVYFHWPMFYTQYCLWSDHLGSGLAYPKCGKHCKKHELKLCDRKGEMLPVRRGPLGRSTVYFGRPVERWGLPQTVGVQSFGSIRAELLDESAEQTIAVLQRLTASLLLG